MITIYNSNLDFDLDSSNSITLSSTSNMVFKTNGSDKMTIQNNGISVSGNVVVSGLITSTGAGFSGIGAGLSNIPISAINELRLELNGGTTELSVTRDTLNASIVSEARFGSNYTGRINSELNTRVDNTSNYVFSTSNILIGRIINTSNYVDNTSNFLSVRIDNTSNYALATSNILIGRIINTSNYVDSTSNFLSVRIDNTSNYAQATSNILIGRIINTSNYVDSTSNFLSGRIDNTSNYALATSNILIGRIINTSNYVESTSNTLIGRIINASNYVESTSNTLIGRIINTSNYVESTSNTLIGRLINTSNYVDSTSNFLSGRIDNTSNYALATSNILIGRIINTSNYVDSTSNILIGRIINTSNYVESTSNTLIGRIINTSNYVDSTSNFLARRIDNASSWGSNYTDKADIWGSNYSDKVGGWGSNYAYDKVGVWGSNYAYDKVGVWGSNYSDKVGVWGSNYAYDKVGIWSSNYADRVGVWGSNYAYDKVGVWSSNYTDRVGGWGSNYAYDKVGVWSSNYTDRIGERTSNYVLSTSNILIGRVIHTSNYVSTYKPATAVRADTATTLFTSRKIANVPFDGSADINISYNSLDNKLNASTGINIDLNNNISATYASTDLLSIFNTTDFADVDSKIELSKNTCNYVLATSNILIGRIINTSNYVESTSNNLIGRIINTSNYVDRINTALTTAVGLKQDTLTAANTIGVLNTTTDFVVNGSKIELTKNTSNYVDRINTALTTAVGLKQDILTAANTIGVLNTTTDFVVNGSKIELTKNTSNYVDRINTALTTAVGLKQDILTAANTIGVLNTTTDFVVNGSKIELTKNTSNYVLATSNILIGRIMNTSNYVSSYKPATAVTADFANRFTNSVNIAGVPFNGTANISIPYNNLDNQLSFGNGLSTSFDNITKITSVTANAAPQEQSDWTQTSTSAVSFIKNKPTIPANTFQLNGSIAFYNSGNVGIGTNAPLSLLEIITANYTGALLTLDAGVINSTTQMPRSIGRPLLKLGKTSYSTSAGDYYGIGFGISQTLSDYNCAEIGTIITSVANNALGEKETGDIIFSTRPGTNNVAATERMRITSVGNVGIGTTDTATYKLNVGGSINVSSLFVGGSAFTGNSQWVGTTNIYNNTGNVAIGTTDTSTAKLFVNGSVRTGNVGIGTTDTSSYNLNVNGTSYVSSTFSTSGTARFYSQAIIDGNVGIGTNNPQNKLHIFNNVDNSRAILTIQDDLSFDVSSSPNVTLSSITGSNDKYMIFKYTSDTSGLTGQTEYSVTFTKNTMADILMIGGGGGGGFDRGGGGGAGACIVAINQKLNVGNYKIRVGNGQSGITNNTNYGTGRDSEIFFGSSIIYRAKGGGSGGAGAVNNATAGGCGGGAGSQSTNVFYGGSPSNDNVVEATNVNANAAKSNYVVLGYRGGHQYIEYNFSNGAQLDGAGGGGIGGAGADHTTGRNVGENGGAGANSATISGNNYNFQSYFAGGETFGVNGFIGGGGGGGEYGGEAIGIGGSGCGGNGGTSGSSGVAGNGQQHTGSGGGGGGGGQYAGGAGGSGIIVIRFKNYNNPEIQLIGGSSISSGNLNYKILNSSGIFKITSVLSNVDTDRIVMQNNANNISIRSNFSVDGGSTKSWRIKHPILKNMDLIHVCIEGTRADNIYRGRKQLIGGKCEVNIDLECNNTGGMTIGTFELINKNVQVFINNNETFDKVIGKVNGNKLLIKCENSNADIFIDWLVVGERCDEGIICNPSTAPCGSIIVETESY